MLTGKDFIAANIEEYGLTGSNVTFNERRYPSLATHGTVVATQLNHFICGYNNVPFTHRTSSTCMYYTDYRFKPHALLSLEEAIRQAAENLYETHGLLYVVNKGTLPGYATVEILRKHHIPFVQIVLRYGDEDVLYPYDARVDTSCIEINRDNLGEKISSLKWLRTRSMEVVEGAYLADLFGEERFMVFPGSIRLVNHNVDDGKAVFAPHWTICDEEEDTALLRFDITGPANGMHILHNLAYQTPEIIAAQLKGVMNWMAMCNNKPTANEGMMELWKAHSPFRGQTYSVPTWWADLHADLNAQHDGGKHNEKWHTPLYRVLAQYGIEFPFDMYENRHVYGEVLE